MEMAQTLFAGGAMHGDIALIESALSAQEFFHLVQLGVAFPHNKFGEYVGYKTDHDPKQRATSAGPWTSNQMFQKLLTRLRQLEVPIVDQLEVISLLTTIDGKGRKVIGAVAIDKAGQKQGLDSLVFIQAENIVMGTGDPGGLYETSVYPGDHLGSTGIAIEAGAAAVNLTEWQYGLASTKFRWNVSGTYQQVIPSYISTAVDGSDEKHFLNEHFPSMEKMATAIFLKGYQWPFDPRKTKDFGSSLIDILVYQETVLKGRKVFLDFRQNIAQCYSDTHFDDGQFSAVAAKKLQQIEKVLTYIGGAGEDLTSFRKQLQARMTKTAAHIRSTAAIGDALREAIDQLIKIEHGGVRLQDESELITYFQNRQLCLTQLAVLHSIKTYIESGGGSRGSYLILDEEAGEIISTKLPYTWRFIPEKIELREKALEFYYYNGAYWTEWVPVNPIPKEDNWFENVWRDYIDKKIYEL